MRLPLALVLAAGVVNAQAIELRSARLILTSGEEVQADGGVWAPEPEFSAYVRACVACQRDSARAPAPTPTPLGYIISAGAGLLLGFVGAVVLWVYLRAP